MRRLAPFSAKSSPRDKPGRFGYLQASLFTLSYSDTVPEVKIAISRERDVPRDLTVVTRSHRDPRELAEDAHAGPSVAGE